jgi:hypothetical protein
MSYLSKITREQREANPTPQQVYADALRTLEHGVQAEVQHRLDALAYSPPEPPAAVRATIPACLRRIT